MIDIAAENNLSETAFAVKADDGYDLRWFTPGGEINLCGHTILATAYVLFKYYENDASRIVFHTLSGDLFTGRRGDCIEMDFPVYSLNKVPVTWGKTVHDRCSDEIEFTICSCAGMA